MLEDEDFFVLPPSPTLGRGHHSRIHLRYEPPGGELGGKIGGAEREREGGDFNRERQEQREKPGGKCETMTTQEQKRVK